MGKNKEVCKTHFALLEETRKAFNLKKDEKEERKKVAEEKKKEKDDAAAIPDGFVKGANTKKSFTEDEDLDTAIKKVDKELKKAEKKKKKEKALDPKKLKKIQKEKERRKRKKEAEGTAGATESEEGKVKEKGTVDFTEEDENMNDGPPVKKSKKSKKKHIS